MRKADFEYGKSRNDGLCQIWDILKHIRMAWAAVDIWMAAMALCGSLKNEHALASLIDLNYTILI